MQDAMVTENKPQTTKDDSTIFGKKLLTMVIIINLMVLVSILLCT